MQIQSNRKRKVFLQFVESSSRGSLHRHANIWACASAGVVADLDDTTASSHNSVKLLAVSIDSMEHCKNDGDCFLEMRIEPRGVYGMKWVVPYLEL